MSKQRLVTDEMVDRACARLERFDDEFENLPYEQATREAALEEGRA